MKQFLAFRAVIPVSTRKSESSATTSGKATYFLKVHRMNDELKKFGGMEFYDVRYSHPDLTDEDEFIRESEQGGDSLAPNGTMNSGSHQTDTTDS